MREWLDTRSKLFQRQNPHKYPPPSHFRIEESDVDTRLSLESQLAKRALHEFSDEGEALLSEVRDEATQLRATPSDHGGLRRIAEKLGRFCIDSDSWGFDDLYLVGMQLQRMVLDSLAGQRVWDDRTAHFFSEGSELLASLLQDCEREWIRRIAVTSYLHFLEKDNAQ